MMDVVLKMMDCVLYIKVRRCEPVGVADDGVVLCADQTQCE